VDQGGPSRPEVRYCSLLPRGIMENRPLALVIAQPENRQSNNKLLPLIPRANLQVQLPSNIPGPGRILNNVYTSVGRVLEDRANRLAHNRGLGPVATTERIEKAFGDSKNARQAMLGVLYRSSSKPFDRGIPELQSDCQKLMAYALP
jgi:hypothetical protein